LAEQQGSRLVGIDLFRVVAFVAVVLIHTSTLGDENPRSAGHIIEGLCRFAVPYFFMVSGYFLGDRGFFSTVDRTMRRLFPIFLIWAMFYCWFFTGALMPFTPHAIVQFLYTGMPGYHLWFLPALGSAILIFAAARVKLGWLGLFVLAAAFYLVGLIFGPWHQLLGLPGFRGRDGPFFALTFVTIGAWWRSRAPAPLTMTQATTLVLLTGGAQLGENWILLQAGLNGLLSGPDMTLMTIPFGISVFALALNWKAGTMGRLLARAGRVTLGMYLIHVFILTLIVMARPPMSLGDCLAIAAITVAASAAVAILLMSIPGVRRLVS
jgi:surface polysaccharide O-acyltransferase-like enzyme